MYTASIHTRTEDYITVTVLCDNVSVEFYRIPHLHPLLRHGATDAEILQWCINDVMTA